MVSDPKTWVITLTGILCHVNSVYPIGAKGDELLDCYQANVMSVCFVAAVSLLLSMKELWPSALKCPSRPIFFLYLSLVSAFTASVSLRMIWLPLTISLTKSNLWMASKIRSSRMLRKSFLAGVVGLLESRTFHKTEMAILAFAFLGYAIKACGIHRMFFDDGGKRTSPHLSRRCNLKTKNSLGSRSSFGTLLPCFPKKTRAAN